MAYSGCESLAASWRKNHTGLAGITTLDLSRNPLGASGAAVLGTAFAAVKVSLRELVVEDCDIRDSGFQAIVNV
jgi:Ran GTPase-activating protein (RanGAP) involved in mRNA processing and transport